MSVQITIVGMGQLGTSIGLALADRRDLIYRVGHDREFSIARQAKKMGALDRVMINLPAAVREADIVLLTLPMDQLRGTLEVIKDDLREGAVVMETGPAKVDFAAWAVELLPEGRYYVGLTPAINPDYLHETGRGSEFAHRDLFKQGLIGIVTPPGVPSDAIKLAADFVHLLGAMPFFIDLLEMDGLLAAVYILPQLISAALVNATVDQPGWQEARKFAGRAYAAASGAIARSVTSASLSGAAISNRENVLRVLDNALAALQALRDDVDQGNLSSLETRLSHAQEARQEWLKGRQSMDWINTGQPAFEPPSTADWFGSLIGMRRKTKS